MTTPNDDLDTESYSGIRLRKRHTKPAELKKKMDSLNYIPIHNLSSRLKLSIYVSVRRETEWATIGIVERTINNTDTATLILRITNLRTSYFDLFLVGKLYDRYKDVFKVGTVLGVTKSTVLYSENAIGFRANYLNQVWHIGESLDLGQCEAYINQSKRCPSTIDRRSGEFCDIHIASVCNRSKNGRMELAGGDSGIDIRWSTTSKSRQGKAQFVSISGGTYSQMKKKEHIYTIKGYRISSDGKELNKKPVINPQQDALEKEKWSKLLVGQHDPGAVNMRKILGITDKKPQTALSKDAFMKVYNKKVPESEEMMSKKRAIDAILAIDQRRKEKDKKPDKKQKYIYL